MSIEQQLAEAVEAYKSGLVPTRPALAKVKRLIKQKLALREAVMA